MSLATRFSEFVMAGLVPAIHDLLFCDKDVEAGHDVGDWRS
jgi:hypothetical protein